jgi:YegS/Rv2252/BmrU family lipid kinase
VSPDVERIVVAGGDGTINEVLNGLDDPLRTPLVHLATGTANQVHRDLGLPWSISGMVDVVERGKVLRVDMGLVGERRFLTLLTAGFDAKVTEQLGKRRPKRLGYTGYFMPIMRALREYRPIGLRVTVDGCAAVTGQLAMVLKVRHYGGFFIFSDRAQLDSGCFEVVVLPHGSVPGLFKYAMSAVLGRMKHCRDVLCLKGGRVHIESDEPVPVQVDGDYFGTTPVDAVIVPASVSMVAPA